MCPNGQSASLSHHGDARDLATLLNDPRLLLNDPRLLPNRNEFPGPHRFVARAARCRVVARRPRQPLGRDDRTPYFIRLSVEVARD
jgi:hypothetical protein